MRALVVYESMFGNTREIAQRVAEGLRVGMQHVDVLPVAAADDKHVLAADLVVVGGPTHAHGMSRAQTRSAAVADSNRYGGGATVEPGAAGPGLREWFSALPPLHGTAAAFDTRADAPAALTGRASRGISLRLHRSGLTLVDRPRSFLMEKGGALKAGEADRAEAWGRSLASSAMIAFAAAGHRIAG